MVKIQQKQSNCTDTIRLSERSAPLSSTWEEELTIVSREHNARHRLCPTHWPLTKFKNKILEEFTLILNVSIITNLTGGKWKKNSK